MIALSQKWSRGSKIAVTEYLPIVSGGTLIALGFTLFFIPFNIVPGGLFGFCTALTHLFGLGPFVGTLSLLINIPLLIWGIKVLGRGFGMKTVVAMVYCSLMIDLMTMFIDFKVTDNILVAAIFGGALLGLGLGMMVRNEATTGGTDTLARILYQKTGVPISRWLMLIDAFVVIFGAVVFQDVGLAPYGVISIFTVSKTLDAYLSGVENNKALLVVSEYHKEIREYILKDLDRGGTFLKGEGMFSAEDEKKIVFSVMNRKESVRLENFVKSVDPSAFIVVINANQVKGSGFKSVNI